MLDDGNRRQRIVARHCVVCHDATLITTPQLTPAQWNRTITEMIEEQGMLEPTPEVRHTILQYLVGNQAPQPSTALKSWNGHRLVLDSEFDPYVF